MKVTLLKSLYEAGDILMKYFGKISQYSVKESQSSIVTDADLEAENKIIHVINRQFPEHNTLGEETGFQNRDSEFTWVIDPLDGTSNFAVGLPWFGVIISVLKKNVPILAGCYIPSHQQLYFAEKGKGATLNGKRITISKESELKNVLVSYSLDYSDEPGKTERETKAIQRLVENARNLRSTNCLLDYCYTADDKLGACINQTSKIWDIAGPGLIIEEAGGTISDIHGNPINYVFNEKEYNRNYTFVGANKTLHTKVIKLINR